MKYTSWVLSCIKLVCLSAIRFDTSFNLQFMQGPLQNNYIIHAHKTEGTTEAGIYCVWS